MSNTEIPLPDFRYDRIAALIASGADDTCDGARTENFEDALVEGEIYIPKPEAMAAVYIEALSAVEARLGQAASSSAEITPVE